LTKKNWEVLNTGIGTAISELVRQMFWVKSFVQKIAQSITTLLTCRGTHRLMLEVDLVSGSKWTSVIKARL